MKRWSSHLLDNLSDCLILVCAPEKFQVSSRGFEPMTSVMPVQCSYELSYKVTQMWAGQFVGLMCSCERNDYWKKCLWSVVERWIEEVIFTLAGQSELLSHEHLITFRYLQSDSNPGPSNESFYHNFILFRGLIRGRISNFYEAEMVLLHTFFSSEKNPPSLWTLWIVFTIFKIFSVYLHLINLLMLLLVMLTLSPSLESSC